MADIYRNLVSLGFLFLRSGSGALLYFTRRAGKVPGMTFFVATVSALVSGLSLRVNFCWLVMESKETDAADYTLDFLAKHVESNMCRVLVCFGT